MVNGSGLAVKSDSLGVEFDDERLVARCAFQSARLKIRTPGSDPRALHTAPRPGYAAASRAFLRRQTIGEHRPQPCARGEEGRYSNEALASVHGKAAAMEDLERRLDRMLESQQLDPELVQELMALPPDYPGLDRIMAKITAVVGDQPASPPLNIEDFYRPGEEPYTLRWPLARPTLAILPMPFEALDHKSQFYVLFQEWTRVELEATTARNGGDLERARTLFEECLARAEQLDVSELKARSHENLAGIYEMAGDRDAARSGYQAAMAERAGATG
jgi:tetratricopeptide (TPR) repeat protein